MKRKVASQSPNAVVLSKAKDLLPDTAEYQRWLADIKARIRSAQTRAHLAVSRELIQLYWDIGRDIVERQQRLGWGKSVIEQLAEDLQRECPGVEGFSALNLWRMRAFYLAYTADATNLSQAATDSTALILSQAATELSQELDGKSLPPSVTQIPWFHNVVLIHKIKNPLLRLWYARQAFEHGWSRAILVHQIESRLHERQGRAVTNFPRTLPPPQSDLAQQLVKDPHNFGFLTLGPAARERELELGLIEHLSKFLVELGAGFAYVGRQVHLALGDDDFYLDLLFYHLKLRCYVVIDLKIGPFQAEYDGKMNLYLNAVDDQLRHPQDQPSIGLILCQDRNRIVAEYALRGLKKAIGVSQYQLTRALPKELKTALPTVEEIERELQTVEKPARKPVRRKWK